MVPSETLLNDLPHLLGAGGLKFCTFLGMRRIYSPCFIMVPDSGSAKSPCTKTIICGILSSISRSSPGASERPLMQREIASIVGGDMFCCTKLHLLSILQRNVQSSYDRSS